MASLSTENSDISSSLQSAKILPTACKKSLPSFLKSSKSRKSKCRKKEAKTIGTNYSLISMKEWGFSEVVSFMTEHQEKKDFEINYTPLSGITGSELLCLDAKELDEVSVGHGKELYEIIHDFNGIQEREIVQSRSSSVNHVPRMDTVTTISNLDNEMTIEKENYNQEFSKYLDPGSSYSSELEAGSSHSKEYINETSDNNAYLGLFYDTHELQPMDVAVPLQDNQYNDPYVISQSPKYNDSHQSIYTDEVTESSSSYSPSSILNSQPYQPQPQGSLEVKQCLTNLQTSQQYLIIPQQQQIIAPLQEVYEQRSIPQQFEQHQLTTLQPPVLQPQSTTTFLPSAAGKSFNMESDLSDPDSSDSENKLAQPSKPVKRGPGRPRKPEHEKKKKSNKTGRLWEFIRKLLHDPETCPSLVKWENPEEGIFRLVHPEKVAKIWGMRKLNSDMNYEKLSRAMRYYYKGGIFEAVLGRRLIYKFGKNAKGWQPTDPNFPNFQR